jgi:hypothetical protein
LNKDEAADFDLELDFGAGMNGAMETETLHAPALDSRETHITLSSKGNSLKEGKCSIVVPPASGIRITIV